MGLFYMIFLGFLEIELTVLLLFSSIFSRSTTKIWYGFQVKISDLDFFGGNLGFFPLGTVDCPVQLSGFSGLEPKIGS
jgi:hypothetical protein